MASEAAQGAEHAASEGGLAFHPMDQFIVRPLFGDGPVGTFTVTNVTLWMAITVLCIFALLVLGSSRRATVPGRVQSIAELAYGFVRKMVEDVAGKDALPFFPYIMTIFMFTTVANFLGLIPTSFTTTSHAAVTVLMALAVFISVTVIGFVRHGAGFLKLFWITAAPLPLRPVLALIEVISYFVRPVSHSIRLMGNMMAGHAVMEVFAVFASLILVSTGLGLVVTPLSILAISAIYALEVLVAFIQAYIFTILTCVYLRDALHPYH